MNRPSGGILAPDFWKWKDAGTATAHALNIHSISYPSAWHHAPQYFVVMRQMKPNIISHPQYSSFKFPFFPRFSTKIEQLIHPFGKPPAFDFGPVSGTLAQRQRPPSGSQPLLISSILSWQWGGGRGSVGARLGALTVLGFVCYK